MHFVTKTYGHEIGLSTCFRQHAAHSHCRFLHGYALAVKITFSATQLDHRNWVVDFGSMKVFKRWLEVRFDHTLLVAEDDPEKEAFMGLWHKGLAKVVIVPAVGCEAFAKLIFEGAESWLRDNGHMPRCAVDRVEVSEHGANSAAYSR